ncbi:DUF72 domain-containing protein [Rhizorhabdus dicambivorans]|uniref:DUF72 domain-containing protein n=1 Tax=Rhizorhabdus dicambivorans TaxID=1850238 RepID=A0A2A4FQ67_9SPHN|nr:DUF72 domain-containing protein [Rhizorhabdus dicambivorans]ATE64476.1 DUF72 domain-containing protein [Rhizorhabdus dicambivorans]PCE39816.1 DUF72 domain-containing protein [Rhizorhabdus dicambivorans]
MIAIIGTAGWAIPRGEAARFPAEGTGLERYARRLGGVEVNSSFYRPHRGSTWARWAASVPADFRFSVKIPKAITHEAKLVGADAAIAQFCSEVEGLGPKLAVLLVQLPPRLAFDEAVCRAFFPTLRAHSTAARIVCEPRNPSWFTEHADGVLSDLRVARVGADPALSEEAARPGGWRGFRYRRLHGSPAMYRSPYSSEALAGYAGQIAAELAEGVESWCIFDNTVTGAALGDALALEAAIRDADRARTRRRG